MEKAQKIRIAATLLALFLFFFNFRYLLPKSISTPTFTEPHPLLMTPTQKSLNTIAQPTVTVTEKKTVTVPLIQTKIVSTTIVPKQKVSTIHLTPISSSINVPRATFLPQDSPSSHKFTFEESSSIQIFLHSEKSVLIYLPAPISNLHISILQGSGAELPFTVHTMKRSPLILVKWSVPEELKSSDVFVKLVAPNFEYSVTLDYSEPLIDPKVWELLDQSNKEVWRRVSSHFQALSSDIQVSKNLELLKNQAMSQAKKFHSTAEKQLEELKSIIQEAEIDKRLVSLSEQMDEYVKIAQHQAMNIGQQVSQYIKTSAKNRGERIRKYHRHHRKEWYKPCVVGSCRRFRLK